LFLGALFQTVVALGSPLPPVAPAALPPLTAREKAALVVVSGLPAPRGVAGVIVREYDRSSPRPQGALVFADQEGGVASTFDRLPPWRAASSYTRARDAFAAGRATGWALRGAGVDVDLAPVLDLAGGPLGSRHFRTPKLGVAFARGLARSRTGACVKHFPGLGTADVSTDESPRVRARLTRRELHGFRTAVRAGVPCVMVGHAFYRGWAHYRASFAPQTYRVLRRTGFDGVAITDSVSVFGSKLTVLAARLALRAGADLVLITSGRDARRAVRALVPLARRGLLDGHVRSVLELRRSFGLRKP
jgi:beta-glucosidase-like glycosyl hydrolase